LGDRGEVVLSEIEQNVWQQFTSLPR
jgi:hypothetical protein